MVMAIYHYVERICRILVTPNFSYNIYDHERYYPGESVNIHIQSLINIIQENNWVINYHQKGVRVNYHYFMIMQNW